MPCGWPDGCGGSCGEGTCSPGQSCGAAGVPNVCAPIADDQRVECFVFDDNGADIQGPSDSIYFSRAGEACIPDGTSYGRCRKWFGKCRTTDSSHTPVMFAIAQNASFDWIMSWSTHADAIRSRHWRFSWLGDDATSMCSASTCGDAVGKAQMLGGRPVRCEMYNDGYTSSTGYSEEIADRGNGRVVDFDTFTDRRWFGRCKVGSCGDQVCDTSESPASCPADCHCGDLSCNAGETHESCPSDCKAEEQPCSGSSACSNRCPGNCPRAQLTCSGGAVAQSLAPVYVVLEDANHCAAQPWYIANSYDEAKACALADAKNRGYSVTAVPGPVGYWEFNIVDPKNPTNGCTSDVFGGTSFDNAAACAAANAHPTPGPCP